MKALALALALILLSSCGGGTPANNGGPINVAGNWNFTITSTTFNITSQGSGALTQSGNTVTGEINLTDSPCATQAKLNGNVDGMSFKANLDENGQNTLLEGTLSIDGSGMSGDYTTPSGGCTAGDKGTFTGTRAAK